MRTIALMMAALLMAALLSACGSSGGTTTGGGGGGGGGSLTGRFVDGPVQGLKYSYGTYSSVTGANGTFSYAAGATVTFKVGDIVIGSAPGNGIITPADLMTSPWDAQMNASTKLLNITRFLMALDDHSVAGTLTIPASVRTAAAGKNFDFAPDNDVALTALITGLGLSSEALPTKAQATSHLSDSIMTLFVGDYSGTAVGTGLVAGVAASFTVKKELSSPIE